MRDLELIDFHGGRMEHRLNPNVKSATNALPRGETAEVQFIEPSAIYPRYKQLKRCAKSFSKRFAIRLSRAQEMLCRASGFKSMSLLSQQSSGDDAVCEHSGDGVSFQIWVNRLRSEIGADFDELLAADEQLTWWRRLHGRCGAAPFSVNDEEL